jgi:hypothetical protein
MPILCLIFLVLLLGCGKTDSAPPAFTSAHRASIKHHLAALGAKVTAEESDELYLSLRNTHMEVREHGGIVHGSWQSRRDVQDFGQANEAIAKGFLEPNELAEFRKWLQKALSAGAPAVARCEHSRFKVTLSRNPLRTVFTLKQADEAE